MDKFFSSDNPFNAALTKIFDLCVLNLLTVLCCLPVVTAGASLTAMYAVMLPMSENKEGSIAKSFFKQFRANLKSSIRTWVVMLLVVLLLLFDLYVWTKVESQYRSVFFGLTIAMLVTIAIIASWYFGLRATFEDNGKTSLINACKYILIYFPASVLMGVYTAGIMYVYLQQGFIAMLTPIFGIALLEYPKAWYMRRKFNAYIEDHSEIYGVKPEEDDTFLEDDDLKPEEEKNPEDAAKLTAEEASKKQENAVAEEGKDAAAAEDETDLKEEQESVAEKEMKKPDDVQDQKEQEASEQDE